MTFDYVLSAMYTMLSPRPYRSFWHVESQSSHYYGTGLPTRRVPLILLSPFYTPRPIPLACCFPQVQKAPAPRRYIPARDYGGLQASPIDLRSPHADFSSPSVLRSLLSGDVTLLPSLHTHRLSRIPCLVWWDGTTRAASLLLTVVLRIVRLRSLPHYILLTPPTPSICPPL